MMPNKIEPIINEFIQEISKVLKNSLKKAILYGSYARGDYNENSDIDIMILTDLNDDEIEQLKEKIVDIAFELELKTGIVISPIIRNIEKFEKRTNIIPFYMNVKREGVILNGRL